PRKDILAVVDRSGIERSPVGEYGNLALEDGLAVITDVSGNSGVFRRRRTRATGCQRQHQGAPPKERGSDNAAARVHSHLPGKGRDSAGDGWLAAVPIAIIRTPIRQSPRRPAVCRGPTRHSG